MLKIIWSKRAENEYFHTIEYWLNHNQSSEYSKKIVAEVEKQEDLISKRPYTGQSLNYKNVRKINILKYFSLIYRIEENRIEILSFWDSRRNPKKLDL